MGKRLVVATTNQGKVKEIRKLLAERYDEILSLKELDLPMDVEEDGTTFEENAVKKAVTVSRLVEGDVLADDSGLEVFALGGRPGVYSARYAGPDAGDEENNRHLLEEMQDKEDRRARFVCCIVMANAGSVRYVAEGSISGEIGFVPAGNNGFGYDPLFFLPDSGMSFAQIPAEEKNRISHRANALKNLQEQLDRE